MRDDLNNVLNDVTIYLENLGEDRGGTLHLSFRRTDDCRRQLMKTNKSPIIYYHCQIGVARKEDEQAAHAYQSNIYFQGISSNPTEAVLDAFSQLKKFIGNT